MIKINFVCLGNICRSPMAEYLFKDYVKRKGLIDEFEIVSSATSDEETGNPVYPPAKRILKSEGIDCSGKRAVKLVKEDGDYYDYIICMDKYNLKNIERIFGGKNMDKVHLLMSFCGGGDVADPYYTRDFDKTYDDIIKGIDGLFTFISKQHKLN